MGDLEKKNKRINFFFYFSEPEVDLAVMQFCFKQRKRSVAKPHGQGEKGD